ncbi:MAG TPA: hypothetical protein PK886_00870 [Candidatus Paceibacterota bacterium]|nr:hypothetical protein [Candidatus Paceibacterota bacterium]
MRTSKNILTNIITPFLLSFIFAFSATSLFLFAMPSSFTFPDTFGNSKRTDRYPSQKISNSYPRSDKTSSIELITKNESGIHQANIENFGPVDPPNGVSKKNRPLRKKRKINI